MNMDKNVQEQISTPELVGDCMFPALWTMDDLNISKHFFFSNGSQALSCRLLKVAYPTKPQEVHEATQDSSDSLATKKAFVWSNVKMFFHKTRAKRQPGPRARWRWQSFFDFSHRRVRIQPFERAGRSGVQDHTWWKPTRESHHPGRGGQVEVETVTMDGAAEDLRHWRSKKVSSDPYYWCSAASKTPGPYGTVWGDETLLAFLPKTLMFRETKSLLEPVAIGGTGFDFATLENPDAKVNKYEYIK